MILKRFLTYSFLFAFIIPLSSVVLAQVEPAKVEDFPLNDLKVKGFDLYQGAYAFAKVSDSKTILFARENPDDSDDLNLRSFIMKKSGKCKKSNLILSNLGFIESVSAFWLGNVESSPSAKGHGIFVALTWEDADPTLDYKLVVTVVLFDANGKSLDTIKLKEFPVTRDQNMDAASLAVGFGDNKILVAFGGILVDELVKGNDDANAVAWLAQLDLNGNILREDIQVNLPDNGSMVSVAFHNPFWTGQRWFIPTQMTKYALPSAPSANDSPRPYQNVLMLTIVEKTGSMKRLMAETPNNAEFVTTRGFIDLSFLPTENNASPAATKSECKLIAHHQQVLEGAEYKKFDFYSHNFYIVTVTSNTGALVGKPKKLNIREWKHSLKYDPNKKFDNARNYISPVMMNAEERLVFAQSRSFTRRWNQGNETKRDSENQNIYYSLDPKKGKVKVLNRSSFTLKEDWTFLQPLIFSMNNKIYVINNLYLGTGPYVRKGYFSIF